MSRICVDLHFFIFNFFHPKSLGQLLLQLHKELWAILSQTKNIYTYTDYIFYEGDVADQEGDAGRGDREGVDGGEFGSEGAGRNGIEVLTSANSFIQFE